MRLTTDQWSAIRDEWEYSPDQLSYAEAANRAAFKHGFKPPSKQTIHSRAKQEGWKRKGARLASVNEAAHDIADRLMMVDESLEQCHNADADTDAENAKKADMFREESESMRASIRARHRKEWSQVAQLRQQALAKRHSDPNAAFHALKIAKITAETTALQQAGECRAWKLDGWIDPARLRQMSEAELEVLASGKHINLG